MIVFLSPNVQGKTPVSLKGQCSWPQDQIDVLRATICPSSSYLFCRFSFGPWLSWLVVCSSQNFWLLSCFCLGKETKSLPYCLKYYLAFYSFYVFLGIYYILPKGFLLGTHWHFIGHQFLLRQLSFWDFFFPLDSGLIAPFLVFSPYPFVPLMFTLVLLEYILISRIHVACTSRKFQVLAWAFRCVTWACP